MNIGTLFTYVVVVLFVGIILLAAQSNGHVPGCSRAHRLIYGLLFILFALALLAVPFEVAPLVLH